MLNRAGGPVHVQSLRGELSRLQGDTENMPTRILVAVDESPQASAALRHTLSTYVWYRFQTLL